MPQSTQNSGWYDILNLDHAQEAMWRLKMNDDTPMLLRQKFNVAQFNMSENIVEQMATLMQYHVLPSEVMKAAARKFDVMFENREMLDAMVNLAKTFLKRGPTHGDTSAAAYHVYEAACRTGNAERLFLDTDRTPTVAP